MRENEIGDVVVAKCIEIHRQLGPGPLERVYEVILAEELREAGLSVEKQIPITVRYKHLTFSEGFRADLIVENLVLLELKSVEAISKAHTKQVLTYLKLTDLRLGYLLNFGAPMMKDGIRRIANKL